MELRRFLLASVREFPRGVLILVLRITAEPGEQIPLRRVVGINELAPHGATGLVAAGIPREVADTPGTHRLRREVGPLADIRRCRRWQRGYVADEFAVQFGEGTSPLVS